MGTIEIKKVERKVTVGKKGEQRQQVKKTYGKIIYRGTLRLNLYRGRGHRCDHQAEELHAGDAGRRLQGEARRHRNPLPCPHLQGRQRREGLQRL